MYPNFKILYFLMDFTTLTFIYLFLAVLGLRCCMQTFSSCWGTGHSSKIHIIEDVARIGGKTIFGLKNDL